jgi:hypothetical protein
MHSQLSRSSRTDLPTKLRLDHHLSSRDESFNKTWKRRNRPNKNNPPIKSQQKYSHNHSNTINPPVGIQPQRSQSSNKSVLCPKPNPQ